MEAEELDAQRKHNPSNHRMKRNTGVDNLHEFKNSLIGQALSCGVFSKNMTELIHPESVDYDQILYSQKDFKNPHCYEKYMSRIKLRKSPSEVQNKPLKDNTGSNRIFSQESVPRLMKVAETNHEFFRKHK
jgi:hypothetical protein